MFTILKKIVNIKSPMFMALFELWQNYVYDLKTNRKRKIPSADAGLTINVYDVYDLNEPRTENFIKYDL